MELILVMFAAGAAVWAISLLTGAWEAYGRARRGRKMIERLVRG